MRDNACYLNDGRLFTQRIIPLYKIRFLVAIDRLYTTVVSCLGDSGVRTIF
jgi:hypothetical protein